MIDDDRLPTVAIHIGNSDQKLGLLVSQPRWAKFCNDTADAVDRFVDVYSNRGARLIGAWYSLPNGEYQSAVFTVQLPTGDVDDARAELVATLAALAWKHGQDSIGCHWSPGTQFVGPVAPRPGR